MPIIVRKSDAPYRWTIGAAELAEVANQERELPRNYISKDGWHITQAARRYLLPLIQGEDFPPFRGGLPFTQSLKNVRVPKRLTTGFQP